MTTNLGATEMSALMNPRLGFNAGETSRQSQNGTMDEKLSAKIGRSGIDAARRKFTPEFINRLDKIVTFKPLGSPELKKILDIELNMVQQRIFNTAPGEIVRVQSQRRRQRIPAAGRYRPEVRCPPS